jgi:hypothetical protein
MRVDSSVPETEDEALARLDDDGGPPTMRLPPVGNLPAVDEDEMPQPTPSGRWVTREVDSERGTCFMTTREEL